jgi:hypothetical protein
MPKTKPIFLDPNRALLNNKEGFADVPLTKYNIILLDIDGFKLSRNLYQLIAWKQLEYKDLV